MSSPLVISANQRSRFPFAGILSRRLLRVLAFAAVGSAIWLWSGPWVSGASATSLWAQQTNNPGGSMFADARARKPGDILTLVIVESSQATQSATTKTGKDASIGIGPGGGLLSGVLPLVEASASDDLSAGGTTTRRGSLTTTMSVTVKEVLQDGNLRIEGSRKLLVNGEEQEIVVSGLVRPQDISPDNRVLSTSVADAEISYKGSGSLGDKQKPGILTRIFRWLF